MNDKSPDRAVLSVEVLIGALGLVLAVAGMLLGLSRPVRALPRSIGALLAVGLHGQSVGIMGVGLWLLALAPVAAVAAGGIWATRQRHWRTAALALVALAAIALAAGFLPAA